MNNVGVDNAQLLLNISLGGVEFNTGKATIEIPFVAQAPAGKVAKVYYIDNNGNKTDMNATFANGKASFNTTHFSKYVIVYEYIQQNDSETPSSSIGLLIGIIAGAVVVLGLASFIVLKFILKKKKLAK